MGPPGMIENCTVFPADNWWNRDISGDSVDSRSAAYIDSIGRTGRLHADWGVPYGIPYAVVNASTPRSTVQFDEEDESDPGPYPIPDNPPIEGDGEGDAHMLLIETDECKLYELAVAHHNGSGWTAYCGAIFDLESNTMRPDGWTSADAAGLPIFPGLVRYDEVMAGEIRHALRFTADDTQGAHVFPATHDASTTADPGIPPMGTRVRLKSSFDISGFAPRAQVILRALQHYGMFLADNGSDWYITGAQDPRWDDILDEVLEIQDVPGDAFEVVRPQER